MFSYFFIDRPIFASVVSIVIVIIGLVGLLGLPVELFPDIAPPTVSVSANYPGASALDVADNVAAPIEQEVNGVENMIYMFSKSTNDGQMALDVTFRPGVDLDMAQVLVQNRVSAALPKIPAEASRQGVTTKKRSPTILMLVNLVSEKLVDPKTGKAILDPETGRPKYKFDLIYQSNYATINIKDVLARLPGAGDVQVLGPREFSMRVWLDPDKLATLDISADDVLAALQEQNVQIAAGQIGRPPVKRSIMFQFPVNVAGKLSTPEEFGDVIVKTSADGRIVYLKDLVRARNGIELAAQSYDVNTYLDGAPSVALAIYPLPGANALETAAAVRRTMEELKQRFPDGLDYRIVYDTTVFINESIAEVYSTLFIAIALVFVVVLVFLQDWRTTVIPMIAVPVSLVGTFAVMSGLGFSLNNLSLFGLILAIGIVVDDAIVVVENTERYLAEGLSPRDAVRKAMAEISGALIATTLVVCAVFVPTSFLAGITGTFYRQFALTIAGSTVISTLNALTISPALCRLLLKPRDTGAERKEALPAVGAAAIAAVLATLYLAPIVLAPLGFQSWWWQIPFFVVGGVAGWFLAPIVNRLFNGFFAVFNGAFDWASAGYTKGVRTVLRFAVIALAVYGGLLVLTGGVMTAVPSGFIPQQDKGYLLVHAQLPEATSLAQTDDLMQLIHEIAAETEGVAHTIGVPGYSLLTGSVVSHVGGMFLVLDDFSERSGRPDLGADAIMKTLMKKLQTDRRLIAAQVAVFGAPPVDGLGNTGGFKLQVQDRGAAGPRALEGAAAAVIDAARSRPEVQGLFTSYSARQPQVRIEIDRVLAKYRKVSISEIATALNVFFGSRYVNDFTRFGRNWQVRIQADKDYRSLVRDLGKARVRNADGKMISLTALINVEFTTGPAVVSRYNMFPAADVSGVPAAGYSSGQAIETMDAVCKAVLPTTMGYEWTELSYQELEARKDPLSPLIFPLCVLFVFLVLAAQYESWTLPMAIILIVPLAILFALTGVLLFGMDNNIFTQIGLVVLIALAAKNAILIVEFAKQKQDEGLNRFDAALEASRLRLRPILMTAFSFILGVVPLVLAKGAGAEMRVALGVAVFFGMLGVTILGIFLTPAFYLVIRWFTEKGWKATAGAGRASSDTP